MSSQSAAANIALSAPEAPFAELLARAPAEATGLLIVGLNAIRRNYKKLSAMAAEAETAAVVKANAYGLGIERVVPALEREGCGTFFVATLPEAELLRRISANATIYVLDGLFPGSERKFAEVKARPVLGSVPEILQWKAFARNGTARACAVHIDTGMNRLGLGPAEVDAIKTNPEIVTATDIALLMSHLACGDEPESPANREQLRRFEAVSSSCFPGVRRSLANSAGLILGPSFHFDLTRPGIALYGGSAQLKTPNAIMEPVVRLYGRIAQLRWAERGEKVGYGAAQTLKRRTLIATLSVGYADGFFRALSASDIREGPSAYIGDHELRLLGRVSMDLTTFDATDVPPHLLQRGGWVELLGERMTVDRLAQFAGTVGYEVLTALGRRYHRVYLDD